MELTPEIMANMYAFVAVETEMRRMVVNPVVIEQMQEDEFSFLAVQLVCLFLLLIHIFKNHLF